MPSQALQYWDALGRRQGLPPDILSAIRSHGLVLQGFRKASLVRFAEQKTA